MMKGIATVTESDVTKLTSFIRDSVKNANRDGVVIGLSGGLDSVTVTKLAVDALGKNVLCIFMPTDCTPISEHEETSKFCKSVGAEYKVINIQKAIDALSSNDDTELTIGNIAARMRMTVLFDCARKRNYLVLGTTNKSELSIGYFTKFGDVACDIAVLSKYYKTQVIQLAKLISIPENIISKAPSAELWEGQTDESELNISYEKLDQILVRLEMSDEKISEETKVSIEKIKDIRKRIASTEHKRKCAIQPD